MRRVVFVTQAADPALPVLAATLPKIRALAARVDEVLAASLQREEKERVKRAKLRAGERSYDLDGLRAGVEGG